MNAFEALDPRRIVIVGDVHANASHMRKVIAHATRQGADAVLQVGDFLYDWWENFDGSPAFVDQVSAAATEAGVPVGFVDGNHDCHPKLQALAAEHDYQAVETSPNVWYLPRGYRWVWGGVSFLAMGGAHSVDRPWRRPHIEWWPGETISPADASRATEGGPVDVVVAHDVPDGVHIPCIEGNPFGWPQRELDAAQRNREVLREIVSVVRPRRLFAGHYHCRLTADLIGRNHRTQVDILDMDERPLEDNTLIVDLASL